VIAERRKTHRSYCLEAVVLSSTAPRPARIFAPAQHQCCTPALHRLWVKLGSLLLRCERPL